MFGFDIPPEQLECVGCHQEGKHLDPNCPVRPCVREKGLDNCAGCNDFGCERLKSRMEYVVKFLDKQGQDISDEDYKIYLQAYESQPRLMKIREKMKTT